MKTILNCDSINIIQFIRIYAILSTLLGSLHEPKGLHIDTLAYTLKLSLPSIVFRAVSKTYKIQLGSRF